MQSMELTNANDLCPFAVKCSSPSKGRRFPTCSEEAEGSTPEYIVVGFKRWVCTEGFVRAAIKPLFSSSDMTGDTL